MKRRFLALGLIGPVMLSMCLAAVLLAGVVGWFLWESTPPPQVAVQVATIAPLATQSATHTPTATTEPESGAELPTATPTRDPATPTAPLLVPDAPPTVSTQGAGGSGNNNNSNSSNNNNPPAARPQEPLALPPNTVSTVNTAELATRLVLPKLEIDAPVVLSPIENQTWKVNHLGDMLVGHLEGTAPPGAQSNMVLAAHITLDTGVYGPFADLSQMSAGDLIIVYRGEQRFQYVVDEVQTVARTSVEVTYPTDSARVTLITCDTWNRAAGRYENRLVVTGRLLVD